MKLPAPVPLYRIRLEELMKAYAWPSHIDRMITNACNDETIILQNSNPIQALRSDAKRYKKRLKAAACEIDGYTMSYYRAADLLLVFDVNGEVAGGVRGYKLLVLPEHRGQGLGAEIVIRAFESGAMHPSRMNAGLTAAGRGNRRAAHRIAVGRAIEAGLDVDPEIVSEYEAASTPPRRERSASPRP